MLITNKKTFYPTPPKLAARMVKKIHLDKDVTPYDIKILEPSAGKGDLIRALNQDRYDGFSGNGTYRYISAIEIDPDLRATLIGKGIRVIDQDFLAFSGPDKFDLIIANPPFDEGDKHLLKAIEILYRGQIIFLLNADTIRNPYTNTRKDLVRKLEELHADIEYIKGAFVDAERPTGVEVALVDIMVERKVEDDLFKGCDDKADDPEVSFEEKYEVSNGKKIAEMVAEYNEIIGIGTETIVAYYRNYRKIGGYIGLNREVDKYHKTGRDLTGTMQMQLNNLLVACRTRFWRKTLDLPEVMNRLTEAKKKEFEYHVEKHCDMDFTENNIRTFILNLINGYEKTLMEAVVDLFDRFTRKHSWDRDNPDEQNIHYFNGWKTNKAFKVNKKVIIPIHAGGYGGTPFTGYSGQWELHYSVPSELADIDKVMNYFDGMRGCYCSIAEAIDASFKRGEGNTKIESTYFTINAYKKGTVHLTFNDEDILRRFNVAACVGKNWLPCDYGWKPYQDLAPEEQVVAESFEGHRSYNDHLRQPLFGKAISVPLLEEYAAGDQEEQEELGQLKLF